MRPANLSLVPAIFVEDRLRGSSEDVLLRLPVFVFDVFDFGEISFVKSKGALLGGLGLHATCRNRLEDFVKYSSSL